MSSKNTDYQATLQAIKEASLPFLEMGKVADYIPELAKVNQHKFGIHVALLNGETFSIGDTQDHFSIQSIVKVFLMGLSMAEIGDDIFKRVGVEPSGDPFNSLVQLEYEKGIPRNPFINAGAIVLTDILLEKLADPKAALLSYIRKLSCDDAINFDEAVAESEKKCGFKNRAIVNLMKSFGNIRGNVEEVLDLYYHFCSVEMNCVQLANAFAVIANHGHSIDSSDTSYLSVNQYKRITAVMMTCGFYDESGEFAFKVGLPGKSGVGGGIAAIMPGEYSVVVWSPGLNDKGNSLAGLRALEMFTTLTKSSIF
ncbi:MAG: glutaminase [Roseivirga sp.]|jgi:glutaminase